jgi:hypothetical protein
LPDGRSGFPISSAEQIQNAFNRVANAYQTALPDFGTVPELVIGTSTDNNAINAFAARGTTVTVNLALAELISDSPSELAFLIAHEVGHIYQQRSGKLLFNSANSEWDADVWGVLISLLAGYDPYAAGGTLGKLAMATGTANLGIQLWEDAHLASEAHGSFSTRIDNLVTMIQAACSSSVELKDACAQYKSVVHPFFPSLPSVPLSIGSKPPSQKVGSAY